jgi:ABC-type transport system substrate-binding protein
MRMAGIDWLPTPNVGTDLFSNRLPRGDYQVVEYESGATVDPSPIGFGYTCDYFQGLLPDRGETYSLRYCNPELDPIMEEADREIDPSTRHELITQIYSRMCSALLLGVS